jgi:SAM-dependent methyltransferase
MAERADRYVLYLKSVQSPDHEVGFFRRIYKSTYGSVPTRLREDFCGTAAVCCEWVRGHPERRALGIDIDPVPLAWGREHNLTTLPETARCRVTLKCDDARRVAGPKADIVAAQNFSFQCFTTRGELKQYFKAAYGNLARRGLLMLDLMGGPECLEEDREEIKSFRGYKYVWEQTRFDPITHACEYFIHFRFPDGSALEKAFHYRWRLWTIPEIRELLAEAGFRRADVYWEDTDRRTGRGNDVYRRREHASSDAAWVCYIVGVK